MFPTCVDIVDSLSRVVNSKVNHRILEHVLRVSGGEELMVDFLEPVAVSKPDKLSLVWIELQPI